MISIDGIRYNVKAEVRRSAEIKSSEISGLMMDGTYFNDVIGTFMAYSVTLKYPLYNQDRYASLYEALTQPVDGHAFVLPYNQGQLAVTARLESVPDEYVEMDSGRRYWKALQFNIIANHPTKAMGLSQVLTRGRAPLPDAASPSVGDTYTWTGTDWSAQTYPDADNIGY